MLPLFKSHYSFGKSLLKVDDIFRLGEDLNEIAVIEDSFASFRKLKAKSEECDKEIRFGIRLLAKSEGSEASKIVLFAKNNDGIKNLRYIFSDTYTKDNGEWELNRDLLDNIQIAIPFYDSFVHYSISKFGIFDLNLDDVIYFSEDNSHIYDYQIQRRLDEMGVKQVQAKSIFYENYVDFPAFQCYKSTCNRKVGRRQPTINAPELEDCGSQEFCWQSYKKYESKS